MGWQYLKSVRQLLVGNEDSALRDVRGNGHETRFLPFAFRHHGHPEPKRTILASPDPRCATRPVFVACRVEKQLRFNRCSAEILGDYRNPI
jgi:hypothetical protein